MEQHWSKDYIEHLRAAHFTLVFLCAAGIIIALAPGKREVSAARQQLDQIRNLVANWDPGFLQVPAKEDEEATLLPDGNMELLIGVDKRSLALKVQQPASFVTLNKNLTPFHNADCNVQPDPRGPIPTGITAVGDVLPAPNTIQEFKDIWNSLFENATLHRPSWTFEAFLERSGEDHHIERAQLVSGAPSGDGITVQLTTQCLLPLSRTEIQNLRQKETSTYQIHGIIAPQFDNLYFPVDLKDTRLDGQALLFRNKNQTWHYGHFDESFPELSEALNGQESASWQDAVKQLTDQEKRTPSESFEAFGMKLPAIASAYGALLMILGLQWYVWAQIYEFRRKLKAADEVADAAWISIYLSLPARILTFTSMFCLPIVATALLGYRGAHSHVFLLFSWPVSVLGFCISAALAFVTYRAMPVMAGARAAAKIASAG